MLTMIYISESECQLEDAHDVELIASARFRTMMESLNQSIKALYYTISGFSLSARLRVFELVVFAKNISHDNQAWHADPS